MIQVTAGEFQRQFGEYQQRAQQEPVEITRHGRRDAVLLSAEHYDRLRAIGGALGVGSLINLAFSHAMAKQPVLHQSWIRASFQVGGRLPDSLLVMSIQSLGQLDMVLRSMEDELAPHIGNQSDPFGFHHQSKMSDQWTKEAYEVMRLLKERKVWPTSPEFEALNDALRLLRIPLDKHEIAATAKERKADKPIPLKRVPAKEDDTLTEYKHSDPRRAIIMPSGLSSRGSKMWMVTDLANNQSRWIERRTLSDDLLALWSGHPQG